jgi:1-acyl-sn-glycerol-3-phosphate acyltransferase
MGPNGLKGGEDAATHSSDHQPSGSTRHWPRRVVTIPLVWLLTAMTTALLPIILLVGGLVDLVMRRRFPLIRGSLALVVFLWAETVGIAVAFAIWLVFALRLSRGRERFLAANSRLQRVWARTLFSTARALFSIEPRIEGTEALLEPGPLLVFSRHASTVDTLLPVVLLRDPDRDVRYVLKRELVKDPCLDIVGHRLPNCFVERGAGRTDEEVARLLRLTDDLDDHDAVVIFPEGTRFTPAKRAHLIEKLGASDDPQSAELARALKATLPPLRRGALALVQATPEVDLVVIAHTGLEPAASLGSLLRGGLVGSPLRVRIRRFRAQDVPREEAPLKAFLGWVWRDVDDFITGADGDSPPPSVLPHPSE